MESFEKPVQIRILVIVVKETVSDIYVNMLFRKLVG
jgi:hypothetical protein